jgi:hypothetical protein
MDFEVVTSDRSVEEQYEILNHLLAGRVNDATEVATFAHLYRSGYSGDRKIHACLRMGYWCWLNALVRPQDVPRWLRGRYRAWRFVRKR